MIDSIPSDITKQQLATNLGVITGARAFPDGSRLLVIEQHGVLQILSLVSASPPPMEIYMSLVNIDAGTSLKTHWRL